MIFQYKALKNNRVINGKVEANAIDEAVSSIRNNGFFPINVFKVNPSPISNALLLIQHVSFTDVVNLTRQIAIMINAGLTLVDSFDILKKQTTKESVMKLLEDIDREIKGGNTFSSALRKYPNLFSNLYIALVRSGEASGKLAEILLKLAENLEKQREFRGKLKGALVYPAIVVTAMLGVMFIMITFVVPKLLSLYKDFNTTLPLSTQILITVSDFMAKFWPFIIVGVFSGVTLLKRYLKTTPGRLMYDTAILKVPVINEVIKMAALVDSTRTLSILISSGVSILEALLIIIDTSENIIYQNAFKEIYKQVEKGISLGQAMTNAMIFPPILVQMTMVGEQTGHLDDTLGRISHYFEMESEMAIKAVTTLIEPAILVFLGIGVGFLVMSVITPIYNLTGSFK